GGAAVDQGEAAQHVDRLAQLLVAGRPDIARRDGGLVALGWSRGGGSRWRLWRGALLWLGGIGVLQCAAQISLAAPIDLRDFLQLERRHVEVGFEPFAVDRP